MAKPERFDLLLVRGGRTSWDVSGRLQGATDLPLCAEGEAELESTMLPILVGETGPVPSAIVSAPDEASRQTARWLARRLAVKTRPASGLAAIGLGLWEGLAHQEVVERHPKIYRQWSDDPTSVNPPQAELIEDGEARLCAALRKAADRVSGAPLAVVLRPLEHALLAARLSGLPAAAAWDIAADPQCWRRVGVMREELRAAAEGLRASA